MSADVTVPAGEAAACPGSLGQRQSRARPSRSACMMSIGLARCSVTVIAAPSATNNGSPASALLCQQGRCNESCNLHTSTCRHCTDIAHRGTSTPTGWDVTTSPSRCHHTAARAGRTSSEWAMDRSPEWCDTRAHPSEASFLVFGAPYAPGPSSSRASSTTTVASTKSPERQFTFVMLVPGRFRFAKVSSHPRTITVANGDKRRPCCSHLKCRRAHFPLWQPCRQLGQHSKRTTLGED